MKQARSPQDKDAFEPQSVFSAYSIKRPSYFHGQMLSAEDFTTEQRYHLEKHRRHNRYCHGVGVVQGLKVSTTRDEFGWSVVIQPGLALDSTGNEIEICHRVQIPLRLPVKSVQVGIRYVERKSDPAPAIAEPTIASQDAQPTRVEEGFEVLLAPVPPRGSSHGDEAYHDGSGVVMLARLARTTRTWTVSPSFKPMRARGR